MPLTESAKAIEDQVQDIHISCPANLVETLVDELRQQLTDDVDAEIYDWGWSCRFQQGYITLSWRRCIPQAFKQKLDDDTRVEGYNIYNLPNVLITPFIVTKRV